MKIQRKVRLNNHYAANGWNFEKTTKYIFECENGLLEAGYFEHYLNEKYVKTVIELPVSYGCLVHCKFCASALIKDFIRLKPEQLKNMLDAILTDNNLSKDSNILLSMTGIGDIYYNYENIFEFTKRLKEYPNICITLSSCLWDKDTLQKVSNDFDTQRIRTVQITYISDNQEVTGDIIPAYGEKKLNFDEIVEFIYKSSQIYYRINYVLIKGVNDRYEDFKRFRDKVVVIKDKTVIRISKLNETCATKKYGLKPTEKNTMFALENFLKHSGIRCYQFWAQNNDNMNCGQLVTEKMYRVKSEKAADFSDMKSYY